MVATSAGTPIAEGGPSFPFKGREWAVDLPFPPALEVNYQQTQGRIMRLSLIGRKYRKRALPLLMIMRQKGGITRPITRSVEIQCNFYLPAKQKGTKLACLSRVIHQTLKAGGVIHNLKVIRRSVNQFMDGVEYKRPRVHITIKEIQ